MNELREIRLVNWHGFQDETIELSGSTLVAGTNATGKTTVLDAIQYALIADQTKVVFNSKASEKKKRTLAGYIRWHTLERQGDDKSGRYNRGACTGYVVLRFENAKKGTSFACGAGVYAGESDQIGDQVFFIIDKAGPLGEVPLVDNQRMVADIRSFRKWVREHNGLVVPSAEGYRDQLATFLGHIPADYYRAITRSVSTRPLGSLDDFMRDFILEDRDVETDALIENHNNYVQYQKQAEEVRRQIDALDQVEERYQKVERAKGELRKVRFRLLHADAEIGETSLRDLRSRVEANDNERASIAQKIEGARIVADDKEKAYIEAAARLQQADGSATLREIEAEIRGVNAKIETARKAREGAISAQRAINAVYSKMTSAYAAGLREDMGIYISGDPFTDRDLMDKVDQFLKDEEPDGRRARSWSKTLDLMRSTYDRALDRAERDHETLVAEEARLLDERNELSAGRNVYPPFVAATLDMLRAKVGEEIVPLCELIEVSEDRWRDAAEAELGIFRFAAVLPPGLDYDRAMTQLERYRDGWTYKGKPVALHGMRILDIEGIRADGRGARPGSMAEKIAADDRRVRSAVDYLVGDVICVEKVTEMRKYRRAVTPKAMAHSRHSGFAHDPKRYRDHYIGKAAASRRIEQIDRELPELRKRISRLNDLLRFADEAVGMAAAGLAGFGDFLRDAEISQEIPLLAERLKGLREREARLRADVALARLAEIRSQCERELRQAKEILSDLLQEKGGLEKEQEHLASALDAARDENERASHALAQERRTLGDETLYEEYRGAYLADREGADVRKLREDAERAESGRQSLVNNSRTEMIRLMQQYNIAFGAALPVDMQIPDDAALYAQYSNERERLKETKLADAIEGIEKARREAKAQIAEHYLYRLFDSFTYVENRITELNRALKVPQIEEWGQYSFEANPRSDMARLYNLIKDVGKSREGSFWSTNEERSEDVVAEIEKLADSILGASTSVAEEHINRLRDYRAFYEFDYIWKKRGGETIHYSSVTGSGSGGEHQLPYYIAMFAAMHQVYRQGHRRSNEPMCGLLLLDEAFSNMDDSNMGAAMAVANRLNLQLIVNTPGDKTHTLIPHVSTTLIMVRDTSRTTSLPVIRRFTKEQAADAIASFDYEDEPALQAG